MLMTCSRRSRWRSPLRGSKSSSSGQATSAAIASGQALAIQSQINFTRENEYEADRIGFQRLEAAGFDVYAMATLMDRMQKSTKFSDGNAPSYLRSHPVTHERIAEAQARAYGKPYKQVADSLDFHLVRALLRSYQGTPREAVAYFKSSLDERKYNSEVAARYGLVASLLAQRRVPAGHRRARNAREDGAAAPDDRSDGRARADGIGAARSRHRALQVGAHALSEQAAAHLRLSAGARPKRDASARPRPFSKSSSRAFPTTARCIASRRARTPTSARSSRSTGTRASSTRGRVISRKPSASSNWRRRQTTATSIRRPSSRRACARCARKRTSRWRSGRTAERLAPRAPALAPDLLSLCRKADPTCSFLQVRTAFRLR